MPSEHSDESLARQQHERNYLDAYETTYYTEPNKILKAENDYMLDLLLEMELPGRRCLDFGCGTGVWTSALADQGASATGVDISTDAVEYCRNTYPQLTFHAWNGYTLPFPCASFDVVLIAWVLQELTDTTSLRRSMLEATRTLRPAGRIVVVDNIYPDQRELFARTPYGDLFKNEGEPSVLRFFSGNSAYTVFEEHRMVRRHGRLVGHSFFEIYERLAQTDACPSHSY
jgi:ubiquinone/menaquinone biosynthesis C-methylase UbiE